jgi:hypothetical protein
VPPEDGAQPGVQLLQSPDHLSRYLYDVIIMKRAADPS